MAPRPAIASAAKGIRPAVSPSGRCAAVPVFRRSTSRGPMAPAGGNSSRFGILSDAESAAPVRARGAALTAIRRLPDHLTSSLRWRRVSLYSDPLRGPAPGSRGAGSSTWLGPPSRTRPLDDAKRGVLSGRVAQVRSDVGRLRDVASLRRIPWERRGLDRRLAERVRACPRRRGAEARRTADILTQWRRTVAPAAGPST